MSLLDDFVDFFVSVGEAIGGFVEDAVDAVSDLFDAPGLTDTNLTRRIRGVLVNKQAANEPLPVIYGKRRVGGIIIAKKFSGSSNEIMWIVLAICEGEIDGYESTEIDGVPDTDPKFGGLVEITDYLGTDSQTAHQPLIDANVGWTSEHRGRGIAYRVIKLTHDPATGVFPRGGATQITQVVRGRKVLDTRTSTTAWSDNSSLCLYDYLINTRFGKGLAASALPIADFDAAADKCDTTVTPFPGAPSQKLFTCNAVLDTSQTVMENTRELLAGMLGLFPYSEGLYKVLVEDTGAAEMSLDEDDIVGGFKYDGGDKDSRYNQVVATFPNAALNYEADEVAWPEADSALEVALLAADNGFPNTKDISLPAITDVYMAQHICRVFLNKSRNSGRVSFTAVPRALELDAGAIIDLTHATPAWTAKLFRVTGLTLSRSGAVGVSGVEHDDTDYGFEVGTEFQQPSSTDFPDLSTPLPPTNLALDSGTAQLMSQGDGTQVSRIKATLTLPLDAFVNNIEFQIKKSADAASAYSGAGGQGLITQRYFANVADGVAYDVRVRSINTVGATSAWIEVTSHTVIGKSADPADVTSFLIAGDDFTWVGPDSEFDFDGTEIRFHYGENESYGDANPLHTGRLLASPFTMAVRPSGPVTFMIKAFDTSGNESANAAVIKTDLGDATVANVVQTFDQKALAWPGTLTDGTVDGSNNLVADVASSNPMWDADPNKAMWTVDSATMWAVTIYDDMVYETTVTVAAAGLGSVMTLANTIAGAAIQIDYRPQSPAAMWTADTEPMWSADGNAMWSAPPAYETWPGSITVANDIYDLRVSTGQGTVQGSVTELTLTVDLPDLDDFLGDIAISAAGTRLPITKAFDTIQVVNMTLQDDAGAAETLKIIDKNAVSGPLVKAFDASAVATTALIDAHVQGY